MSHFQELRPLVPGKTENGARTGLVLERHTNPKYWCLVKSPWFDEFPLGQVNETRVVLFCIVFMHSLSPGTTSDIGMRVITFVAQMSTGQMGIFPCSPDVQSREFCLSGEREKEVLKGSSQAGHSHRTCEDYWCRTIRSEPDHPGT
jgi:hypothetical protein